jgi:hypothetical protein
VSGGVYILVAGHWLVGERRVGGSDLAGRSAAPAPDVPPASATAATDSDWVGEARRLEARVGVCGRRIINDAGRLSLMGLTWL